MIMTPDPEGDEIVATIVVGGVPTVFHFANKEAMIEFLQNLDRHP